MTDTDPPVSPAPKIDVDAFVLRGELNDDAEAAALMSAYESARRYPPAAAFPLAPGSVGVSPAWAVPLGQPAYAPPATSGIAVASLVLGVVGLLGGFLICGIPCLVAVLLGHSALADTRPATPRWPNPGPRKAGYGMAVAGLITGYLGLAPALLALAWVIAAAITGAAQ